MLSLNLVLVTPIEDNIQICAPKYEILRAFLLNFAKILHDLKDVNFIPGSHGKCTNI